jgi:hypothetical protein
MIINTKVPTAGLTAFQFQLTPAAATHNALVLRKDKFEQGKAITAKGGSPLKYGSKFCPKSILAPLLDWHLNWKYTDKLLTYECSFIALTLSEADQLCQLDHALSFGNHKGTLKKPQQLLQLLNDDVTHGYNLPVTIDLILKSPGLVLLLMNITHQNTTDEMGWVIEKDQLMDDYTYKTVPWFVDQQAVPSGPT